MISIIPVCLQTQLGGKHSCTISLFIPPPLITHHHPLAWHLHGHPYSSLWLAQSQYVSPMKSLTLWYHTPSLVVNTPVPYHSSFHPTYLLLPLPLTPHHSLPPPCLTLNNVLGRNKLIKLPDLFKDSDGNKITDSKKIANNFNKFFTNIGTKLANKISSPDSNYVSPLKSKNQQNSIYLTPTNPDEIIKITKNLKTCNSSGIDNISTKLLKMIINEIAPSTCLYSPALFHHN